MKGKNCLCHTTALPLGVEMEVPQPDGDMDMISPAMGETTFSVQAAASFFLITYGRSGIPSNKKKSLAFTAEVFQTASCP